MYNTPTRNVPNFSLRDFIVCLVKVALILLAMALTGCSSWSYSRTEFDKDGEITNQVKASGGQLIIDSEVDKVLVEVNGDNKVLSIGSVHTSPDDEALGTIVGAAVKAALGGM